jgi:hypothetical protein
VREREGIMSETGKITVRVKGVELTRQELTELSLQLAAKEQEARRQAERPRFQPWEKLADTETDTETWGRLSETKRLSFEARSSGEFRDMGLFLPRPPVDYSWKVVKDTEGSWVLVQERKD